MTSSRGAGRSRWRYHRGVGRGGPILATVALALACQHPTDDRSAPAVATPGLLAPGARVETAEALRRDLETARHPSDGGGRAWLERGPERLEVDQAASFEIVYEAGELGVAIGGALYFQGCPFWGWSPPQFTAPDRPGYTTAVSEFDGVALEARAVDRGLVAFVVSGRALAAGELVRVTYGAGEAGARAGRYADRTARLWLAVDGDGDGVRAVVADSPAVTVGPGPPARLVLTLPSVVEPREPARLTVAVLDGRGNAGVRFAGEVRLRLEPELPDVPELAGREGIVTLRDGDGGVTSLPVTIPFEGVWRVRGRTEGGLEAESNPMQVAAGAERVLWADLHGHSNLSDGTGTPEDYFRYARDVAALDVAALTDHDHWGMRFLDSHADIWQETRDQVRRFHRPGRFVALLGYEWTSWLYGHRHVLYFGDEGEVLSSSDPRYERPDQLWQALKGRDAMTVAHHSAGGPVATSWAFPPDPELEPVTEVASVHGASEAADAPSAIYDPVAGNFVRDALDRGLRLGFVGSGDGHDGHPGLAHLNGPSGGVAAILAPELSREAVRAALLERRVYATNGPRIVLRATLGGEPMGAVIPVGDDGRLAAELEVTVMATAPVARVEVIRSGRVVEEAPGEGLRDLAMTQPLEGLRPGEYVYLRVVQEGGGAAWSSPWFVVDAEPAASGPAAPEEPVRATAAAFAATMAD